MTMHTWSEEELTAALRGVRRQRPNELAALASLADDLRAASSGLPPQPSAVLAFLLDRGLPVRDLSADKGDLPVTAASKAPGPAGQVSGLPKGRRKMIVEWMAGLSLMAKAGLGASVAAASVTGVGVAGELPGPAQEVFTSVVGAVTPGDQFDDGVRDPVQQVVTPDPAVVTPVPSVVEDASGSDSGAGVGEEEALEDTTDDAEDVRDDIEDAAKSDADNAEDAAENVKANAADAAESVADDAEDAAEDARDDAEDDAEDARDDGKDAAEDARDDARDDAEDAEDDAAEDAHDAAEDAAENDEDDSDEQHGDVNDDDVNDDDENEDDGSDENDSDENDSDDNDSEDDD